ncbi:carbohydrate porin, partial [Cronobacter sakazakii]
MIKKSTLALTLGLMASTPAAFADSNMSSIEARLAAL